jgi:hypothetical protein
MPAAVTFVLEMFSSRSEGLCRREDTLVMELQYARLSFVNVTMHSSPAMPASVNTCPVQDELTQRGAVTKAGDRGDVPAVRQVQHLQRGDPLQPDDAHVSHERSFVSFNTFSARQPANDRTSSTRVLLGRAAPATASPRVLATMHCPSR